MARTQKPPTVETFEVTTDATPALTLAAEQVTASVAESHNDAMSLGVMLGKIQALTGVSALTETAAINVFAQLKENKAWKHLRKQDGTTYAGLEDVCTTLLGRSYRRLQQLQTTRQVLGNEAFEYAAEIGLRQLDYDAIKALPSGEQELIKRALADKAAPAEIRAALEIAIRKATEQETALVQATEEKTLLTGSVTAMTQDLKSNRERLVNKQIELDDMKAAFNMKQREAEEARKFMTDAPINEVAKQCQMQVTELAMEINAKIVASLRSGFEQLQYFARASESEAEKMRVESYMSSVLDEIGSALNRLRGDYNLSAGIVNPHWASAEATLLRSLSDTSLRSVSLSTSREFTDATGTVQSDADGELAGELADVLPAPATETPKKATLKKVK